MFNLYYYSCLLYHHPVQIRLQTNPKTIEIACLETHSEVKIHVYIVKMQNLELVAFTLMLKNFFQTHTKLYLHIHAHHKFTSEPTQN